ncbi:hypothetical protein KP509_15G012200 [Ceratopteris richardii]|uniref:Uncharacterized protein n=1 Tax=Ceratopteris richardii TaxID=49495 RepID=A0A8T2T6Z8_CERRI|nr:hypothetical protein KP509_15G012200 [Ceratopteris richardii]
MASYNNNPSHSYKDRPRSRLNDSSRQHSSSYPLEREKSPSAKTTYEIRDSSTRDTVRRGSANYSGEREGGDGLLSTPDRFRGSFKRSIGFESVERPRDLKPEVHRSARQCIPSRNPDRDMPDTGARGSVKRSIYGDHGYRHDTLDELNSSSFTSEREKVAPRNAYDRGEKWTTSFNTELDGDIGKTPVSDKGTSRRDVKEPFRASPTRHSSVSQSSNKDAAQEKERTESSTMKKDASERSTFSSPGRASASGRDEYVDINGNCLRSKTFEVKVRELEQLKDQELYSHETEIGTWKKSFPSHLQSALDDAVGAERLNDSNALNEEVSRERSPVSFLHISKKARSERERGRKDDYITTCATQNCQWNEISNVDVCKVPSADRSDDNSHADMLECNSHGRGSIEVHNGGKHESAAKENEEFSVKSENYGAFYAKDRTIEKGSAGDGDDSHKEEGELEPDFHTDVASMPEQENSASLNESEGTQNETCLVLIQTGRDKEVGEDTKGQEEEGMKMGFVKDGDDKRGNHNHINDNNREKAPPPVTKEEKQDGISSAMNIDNSFKGKTKVASSMSKLMEADENSRSGSIFDLPNAANNTDIQISHQLLEKTTEFNRRLTLSLFASPDGRAGKSSQHKDASSKGSNIKQIDMINDLGAEAGEDHTELFSHKHKKLKAESLQLSLALPESFNMAGTHDPSNSPGLVEPERDVHSMHQAQTKSESFQPSQTYTNSDGFTSSFSFSQSESFIHNPSCSLNCTSLENQELSCGGTRQLSQGMDQISNRSYPAMRDNEQGMHTITSLAREKSKHIRNIPPYAQALHSGNIIFHSVTGSNRSSGTNHVSHKNDHQQQDGPKTLDSSSHDIDGSVWRISSRKDIMERVRQHKAWFASKQQAMSSAAHSEPNAVQATDKKLDSSAINLKLANSAGKGNLVGERNILSEKIGLHEITTEQISVMGQKLQELPDAFLEGLKDLVKGILSSFEKRDELLRLQENMQRRTDLNEDSLLRAHPTQLEILVALKTGMKAFLEKGSKPETHKAFIEIFLNTRCKNIACQQPLPADGCDCVICSSKGGFCHQCMCIVCCKFDSDYNTCRWLGCDLCMHWCHTDCGLRKSYIAPTSTPQSTCTAAQMQYHCIGCGRNSELFGFVKDVFEKCAESWDAEALAKELDFVRRIFHGSEDTRGKQLCLKAEEMLQKLESKAKTTDVCRSMLQYFKGGISDPNGANRMSSSTVANDDGVAEPATESMVRSSSILSTILDGGTARAILQKYNHNVEEKRSETAELQYERARIKAEIENIESAVRIKQAEAKMFQLRADEALKDAQGLQNIISVRKEKIEDDYSCKYANLRINEAEEKHQKRSEELKVHENAQRCFQSTKIMMQAQIKELMLKMDIVKAQYV